MSLANEAAYLAAASLHRLKPKLHAVGVSEEGGRPVLLAYAPRTVAMDRSHSIPSEWEGFKVTVKVVRKFRPADEGSEVS